MIMKGRVPLRLPLAGVFTIALVAAATLPAWATGQQSAPPPPPRPAAAPPTVKAVPPPPAPAVQPPAAPAAPRRRAVPVLTQAQQAPPASAPTPPSRAKQATAPAKAAPEWLVYDQKGYWRAGGFATTKLPAEGQQLVQTYDADVDAIYKEIEQKVEARRQAAIKSLEVLQDQLTKAGKLDEAVAIRDYLRAGGPAAANSPFRFTFFNKGR